MSILIVVDNVAEWPFDIAGVDVINARGYLAGTEFGKRRGMTVFNLCRSYKYQSLGYYVTLLATARGHRPVPGITTIQDLKSQSIIRVVSDELDDMIQSTLKPLKSREHTLSIYFGHNLAKRYDTLSLHLFNLFPAPLLRATFARPNGKWVLRTINPIPVEEIPTPHRGFVLQRAKDYFAGRRPSVRKRPRLKYDLAILVNSDEQEPPSDSAALKQFMQAAEQCEMRAELIGRDDFARLAEFDALFIRETTQVNHYTYRFARRAEAEGLVVMDDPESILKCGNKVYLAELLTRHKISTPRTLIVHRDNVQDVSTTLGLPCILKQPDSAFSQGVVKVDDQASLEQHALAFLEQSELVIAQEFLPTSFDWRVGICDGEPLFTCKYHMAGGHWQIIKRDDEGRARCGKVGTVPVSEAPDEVVQTALKAAGLIGNGLYGVDLKEIDGQVYVIEINDNPNVDAGNEDDALGEDLYRRIMAVFLKRIEHGKLGVDDA